MQICTIISLAARAGYDPAMYFPSDIKRVYPFPPPGHDCFMPQNYTRHVANFGTGLRKFHEKLGKQQPTLIF